MNSSFHAVIANLNTSLRNPVDRGDGEHSHSYVRTDELAAAIAGLMVLFKMSDLFCEAAAVIKQVEACDK